MDWDMLTLRDGPFDIQGLGFLLTTSCFFSLVAQQVIFSKLNCTSFLYFMKK